MVKNINLEIFYEDQYCSFAKKQLANEQFSYEFHKGYFLNDPNKIITTCRDQITFAFMYHSEDGPAYVDNRNHVRYNFLQYVKHGELHRLDGPAVIHKNGTALWYVNNKPINFNTMDKWFQDNEIDQTNMSQDDRNLLKLFLSSFQ